MTPFNSALEKDIRTMSYSVEEISSRLHGFPYPTTVDDWQSIITELDKVRTLAQSACIDCAKANAEGEEI